MARSEIMLASKLKPVKPTEFSSVAEIKKYLVHCIEERRKGRQQGIIAQFDSDHYDPDAEFVKIGIRAGVRMVEGWAFIPEPSVKPNHADGNQYVRLCFAALTNAESAKEAAKRIKTVLETPKMREEALKIEI